MKIQYDNLMCSLSNYTRKEYQSVKDACSARPDNWQTKADAVNRHYANRGSSYRWDGWYRALIGDRFPTGLLPKVLRELKEDRCLNPELEYTGPNNKPLIALDSRSIELIGKTPRGKQYRAVEALLKNRRGMVVGATGSGKTLMMGLALASLGHPKTLVLQYSTYLVRQTANVFREILPGNPAISMVYEDHEDWSGDIVVAGVQKVCSLLGLSVEWRQQGRRRYWKSKIAALNNKIRNASRSNGPESPRLRKVRQEAATLQAKLNGKDPAMRALEKGELAAAKASKIATQPHLKNFRVFIVDEAHHSQSSMYRSVRKECPNADWAWGFTATHDDQAPEERLSAIGVLGSPVYRISMEYQVRKGFAAEGHVFNRGLFKSMQSPHTKYMTAYSRAVVRDSQLLRSIKKDLPFFVNNGMPAIISVDVSSQGLWYAAELNTHFVNGKTPLEERERLFNLLATGECPYLVVGKIMNEGVDIPAIQGIFLAGQRRHPGTLKQIIGRASRQKKHNILYVINYINYNHPTLFDHSMFRITTLEEEECFVFHAEDTTLRRISAGRGGLKGRTRKS